jgi:4-amino-4-deoxy-L-arabinose transferase-like glycosyltransferase
MIVWLFQTILSWRRAGAERILRSTRHRPTRWSQKQHAESSVAPRTVRKRIVLLPALLAGLGIVLLTVTAPAIGLTWDEPTYIVASESYAAWFSDLVVHPGEALSTDAVNRFWAINHEHPPLDKAWSGLVWLMARHGFDDLTAHRLGNMLLVGLLVALLYAIVASGYGVHAGVGAVAALLTMPRFFFHAHLAALDVPVAVMIFAVICGFWVAREQPSMRWTALLGFIWGLALATKIDALFVPPIVLAAWVVLFRPSRFLFSRLALMGLIGVAVFCIIWPWLYRDTIPRLMDYLSFMTLGHYAVEQYYLGRLFVPPPWHFPFVMTVVVVPLALGALALAGAWHAVVRSHNRPLGSLFLLGSVVSVAIFATGKSQVFDNERLFMPAFPFIAALAGIGIAWATQSAQVWLGAKLRFGWSRPLAYLLISAMFVPHVLLASDLYPHLLSYYSEGIGGVWGAQRLGLETTYWCESYSQVLNFLNTNLPRSAVVWAECQDVLLYYQLHDRLRSDLQIANGPEAETIFETARLNQAGLAEADYVVIQYRQSGHYRAVWQWLLSRRPLISSAYHGIPLVAVFQQ